VTQTYPKLPINMVQFDRVVNTRWRHMPPLFGIDGFSVTILNKRTKHGGSIIVSHHTWEDGWDWLHASINYQNVMPDYFDLKVLHLAVFGRARWAYQIFAPEKEHVNITPNALHLWGRADGTQILPDFIVGGMI